MQKKSGSNHCVVFFCISRLEQDRKKLLPIQINSSICQLVSICYRNIRTMSSLGYVVNVVLAIFLSLGYIRMSMDIM